jgi:hypothetical protein
MPFIDIAGKRFGHWTALARHPERSPSGDARWLCRCDCGTERVIYGHSLRAGASKSCGCAQSPLLDLTGQTFGRWAVIALHPERSRGGQAMWACRCRCGTRRVVSGSNLRSSASRSCGCYRRERGITHGLSNTRAYACWHNMLQRCFNPKHPSYPDYGGRGIGVCEDWLSVASFFADMGGPPNGLSLNRVDNDGHYWPSNCEWATPSMQNANRRPRRRSKADSKPRRSSC